MKQKKNRMREMQKTNNLCDFKKEMKENLKLTIILSSNQYTHTQKSWYDCKYSLIKQAITNLVDKKAKTKKNGRNIFLKTQFNKNKKNERLNLNWLKNFISYQFYLEI